MCTIVSGNRWERAKEDIKVFKVLSYHKCNNGYEYITPYQFVRCCIPGILIANRKPNESSDGANNPEWPFFKKSPRAKKLFKIYDGAIHSYSYNQKGLTQIFFGHDWNHMSDSVLCLAYIPKGELYMTGINGYVVSKRLVLNKIIASTKKADGIYDFRTWYHNFGMTGKYLSL